MGIESPRSDQQLHTDRAFLIVGYALDRSASLAQGVQGSGIDRVQLFQDVPPGATSIANAELGFSDAGAATFGSQFANSGLRLMFHPNAFPAGSHNLYVVAHSAVTGEQVAMLFWISITHRAVGRSPQRGCLQRVGGAAAEGAVGAAVAVAVEAVAV
jgi:hypothetical protein